MNPPRLQFSSKALASRLALFLALFTVILGAKFILIDRYGTDLPYWDQWDAEGDMLIHPYMHGQLTPDYLFRAHNEHRLLCTRLLTLGLFVLNDHQWDSRLEMLANAVLHAGCALLLLGFARRCLPPAGLGAFAVLTALFFSMNVSWENTLVGFQSQFYFVLLFTCLHLGGTFLTRPRSLAWWLAPLAGLANLFSMASGLLSAVAILAVTGLACARDRRVTRDQFYILAANALLAGAGWLLKTEVPTHAGLKAQTAGGWLEAWLHQLAWPIVGSHAVWFAVIGLVPPLVLLGHYLRRRIDGPVALTLLGLCTWSVLQAMAIAYARGGADHGYASRYTDVLAIGVLANLLALAVVARHAVNRRLLWGALGLLALTDLAGLWRESTGPQRDKLRELPALNLARTASVREYLASRPAAFFQKAPWTELPYPSAKQLAYYLDLTAVRAALPASVRPPVALVADAAATRGFAPFDLLLPAGPSPLSLRAWSGAPDGPATFLSQSFTTDHSRVTLLVKADAAAPVQLRLTDPEARTYEPLAALPAADGRYHRVSFSAPAGTYRLEVSKTGPGRLSFTQPSTDTPLSLWAAQAVRAGPWLLGAGALLGLTGIGLLFRTPSGTDVRSQVS